MRDGLITSGDFSYFILVIILFLGLTILLLHSGRAAKARMGKGFKISWSDRFCVAAWLYQLQAQVPDVCRYDGH